MHRAFLSFSTSAAIVLATLGLAPACSSSAASSPSTTPDAAVAVPEESPDAGSPAAQDAGEDAAVALTGQCASTFGSALTDGFGRIDGVVYAVQKPSDTQCVMPNADHVVVQVLVNGAVYRMVVNVKSDRAGSSPDVRYAKLPHALPAPAWAEGWHTDAPLDYVTTLGASTTTTGFSPTPMNDLVSELASVLVVGAPVSVYATSGDGRPESAHLVHRNKTNQDGAIVLSPSASPTFLLFHFDGQTF